jgi:transcriptional regulator with XRE-family HTH domain
MANLRHNSGMSFAEKFASLRGSLNLSQSEMPEKLRLYGVECSKGTVGNWEKGTHWPDVRELAGISRFFGVSANYLTYDEIPVVSASKAYPLPPEVQREGDKVRHLKTETIPKSANHPKRRGSA